MQSLTLPKVGKAVMSENGHYIIVAGDTHSLYVHPADEVANPHYCLVAGIETLTYKSAKYARYAPEAKFLRDCLHTAEEIMADKKFDLGGVHSKVGTTGTSFGVSDEKNIAAAKAAAANESAAPEVEQAYVIVVTKPPVSGDYYPYHAAAVVASDGDDRITLEVFASGRDASNDDRSATGDFEMYSVSDSHASFHTTWKGTAVLNYSPVTIVLESKPEAEL